MTRIKAISGGCPYCSSAFQQIYHGGVCPRVAEIEYHPSGDIKRVRFHAPQQNMGPWRTVPDDYPPDTQQGGSQ